MSTPCGVIKYFSTLFDFIGNLPKQKKMPLKRAVYITQMVQLKLVGVCWYIVWQARTGPVLLGRQ
jgi:hypothetical protein